MPRKKNVPNAGTKNRIKVFLEAYADSCNILAAAKKAGINRKTHYRWMEQYPRYRAVFMRTSHLAREYLESELVSRSTKGWLEPIFYQGVKCGSVRRFDGSTGMALLRGMWPEKYGTQRQEISGPAGAPMQAEIKVVFIRPGDVPES